MTEKGSNVASKSTESTETIDESTEDATEGLGQGESETAKSSEEEEMNLHLKGTAKVSKLLYSE